jgi:serine/threonine-protein kinase
MSYCLNPVCPGPDNPADTELCQTCGCKLSLRDRYRATRVLGQGGFGATFLAKDESLPGRPTCVIKQLRPAVTTPDVLQMARELFEREAATLAKIGDHPQIPRLLDYFALDQEFYLVQQYVSGFTLQQEVRRSGALDEEQVKRVLSEVLSILHYIHNHQVIHRDIKSANIIRRELDSKLVLIDFGAVKDQVSQTVTASEDEAFTAFAVGTSGYAPPEQMAMRPVYASDVYALGVTCVYLLTGKSPRELGYDSRTGELQWRDRVRISDPFANVIGKMLEASVYHRYQSVSEVLQALEDLKPFLNNLSQGMTAQTATVTQPVNQSGSTRSSPFARAAMAIQAQRTRLDSASSQPQTKQPKLASQDLSRQLEPSTRATSGRYSSLKAKGKLSAKDLQVSYSKGERNFTHKDLSSLILQKANLSGAIFYQANLQRADLEAAKLFNGNFGRANLAGAILRNANLSKAYLNHADLQGADLRGANLSDASLTNANLQGTNLCGANLTGSTVTKAQLAMARTNWTTVLPSGKKGWW